MAWDDFEHREECEEDECEGECMEADPPDRFEDYDEDYLRESMFADPGGRSALRAETPDNPRNLPCPTCGGENRLTPADVACGYQCDSCADKAERGWD